MKLKLQGFCTEEKALKRTVIVAFPRWLKVAFFLFTMVISLLLFSAPVLLAVADAVLPAAVLTAAAPLNFRAISSQIHDYDFRRSLIDVPIVSIARSAVILCVYSLCDGPRLSRGPYVGVTAACAVASLAFASLKASYLFAIGGGGGGYGGRSTEAALLVTSVGLGIGHVAAAYRTSCRERRKLMVYKIDIEAVSAYQKILQETRTR